MTAETDIERVDEFRAGDIDAICGATEQAIEEGLGFDWIKKPSRQLLEAYWRGVLLVPDRALFVARLEGMIVGTSQLVKPSHNNEAGNFNATITTFFVAPWARGHGLARGLLDTVIRHARREGFKMISLDVRETQTAAISLYESAGFERWGTKPKYAYVDERFIAGHYYFKDLEKSE